ncbi:Annexin D3 [Morus notabilis]|uniref:Annexin n=1 Tax=Morus notabilis TaxID=981085 RepID=W9RNS8_9ROSA|nr:annexin D3 [Morus notabilis]EXB62640.1 Annexin D3 [Morus notabilis]
MYSFLEKLGSLGSSRSETISSVSEDNNNGSMATIIVPDVVPSPVEDCQRLHKAFEGLGTDEKDLIKVLGHRNASQRKEIRETYLQLYNQSLIDALQSELSGDFRKAIVLWTMDPPERDAKLANEALKMCKKGVKYLKIIIEIACATSPDHLMAVRQAYCSLFHCSFEEDIASHVSSLPLRKLLVGLVSSYRYEREVVDLAIANSEASTLNEAIKTKKLDQDHVVWILSVRNFYQLKATFECYEKNYGNAIDKDIKSSGKGDLQNLLGAAISCIELTEKHFAVVIKESVAGLGTDEDSLTRGIVTRAEIDMVRIKEQYRLLYKGSLDADVIDDTSGDYRDFLMTLLGKGI